VVKPREKKANGLLNLLRSLLGALILALMWLVIGWLLVSWSLGFVLAAWSLVLGPCLLPELLWIYAVLRSGLKRLDLSSDPVLAREYLRCLSYEGPSNAFFDLWARPARSSGILWFESLLGRQKTVVLVSSYWLASDNQSRQNDFKYLWRSLNGQSSGERRMRTFQMRLWMGALSPLELFFSLTRLIFEVLGFKDIPLPGFWAQIFLFRLKRLWFGGQRQTLGPYAMKNSSQGDPRFPRFWSSVTLGVWTQIPKREAHPAWPVLSDSTILLPDRA
jgi:hypothetical protein